MSTRTRTARTQGRQEAPSQGDVRRQLEGRVELLEVACERYRMLGTALRHFRWQRALRARRALVAEVLEHEPAVLEALERTRRRAEAEGWPARDPVLTAVRELERWRERLHARVRRRLGEEPAPGGGEASLAEGLARLDASVGKPVRLTLAPAEAYIFEAKKTWAGPKLVVICGGALLGLLLYGGLSAVTGIWGVLFGLLLSMASARGLFLTLHDEGLVLTTERLLWTPVRVEPVEVRLDSIPEGGVGVEPSGTLVVQGERTVRVRGLALETARFVAFLVDVLRQPGLLDRVQAGRGVMVGAVCFPAVLHHASGAVGQQGQAVLTSRAVFLLPEDAGPQLLRLATGLTTEQVPLAWVVEMLRWLPEPGLETYLTQAAQALGGLCWWRQDASYLLSEPFLRPSRVIIYSTAGKLQGTPDPAGLRLAKSILQPWVCLDDSSG